MRLLNFEVLYFSRSFTSSREIVYFPRNDRLLTTMIVYFTCDPCEGFSAIVKVSVKVQDLKAHFCEIL